MSSKIARPNYKYDKHGSILKFLQVLVDLFEITMNNGFSLNDEK